ncbi:MAG: hypothetical protein AAGO57_01815, partial [Pseudomonadota bacterium]
LPMSLVERYAHGEAVMIGKLGALVSLLLLSSPAFANPVSGKVAEGYLFQPSGRMIQMSSKLSERQRRFISVLIPLMEKQLNKPLQYYGSIAFSPDEGFQSDASQSALNYHSTAAADRAAIAACNKNRKSGTRGCVLAARILPKGFSSQPLTLSTNATAAFEQVYQRSARPKALAVSASTGAYGVGSSNDAMAVCRREAKGANDCQILVAD